MEAERETSAEVRTRELFVNTKLMNGPFTILLAFSIDSQKRGRQGRVVDGHGLFLDYGL